MKYLKITDIWDTFVNNQAKDSCPAFDKNGKLFMSDPSGINDSACSKCVTWDDWRSCWGKALSKISVEK